MGQFDFNAGLSGAATGMALGGPIGAGIAGVGALLSGLLGGPQMPKDLQRLLRMQINIARELRARAHSIPMSDPLEQAALAQDRGLLGEQQRGSQQELYAANGMANAGNQNDMMLNLNQQQTGQQQLVNSQHLLAAVQSRREDLMNAAQVARGATAGYPGTPPNPLPAAFGNLAQMIAYRTSQQGNRTPPPGATSGGGWPRASAPPTGVGSVPTSQPSPFWGGGASTQSVDVLRRTGRL